MILDLGLPDMDGMAVIKSARQWSKIPILVVSARDQELDKVRALDLGADDYVTKPFGTSELLARIRTELRHAQGASAPGEVFRCGGLTVDFFPAARVCGRTGGPPDAERFRIVDGAGEKRGRVLTYDALIAEVCGPPTRWGTTRSCASTWPTSAESWKKTPPFPGTSSPKSAWATDERVLNGAKAGSAESCHLLYGGLASI
jgi:DNA-binding response OmpR family regulator